MFAPDGRELPSQPGVDYSAQLPTTGDYTIVVGGGHGDSSPTCTLTVRILRTQRPAHPVRPRHEHRLAPRRRPAGDERPLRPARSRADDGRARRLVHNITFSIVAPDGTVLAADQERAAVVLPVDGDYLVVVETTSSGGPYQITFWID